MEIVPRVQRPQIPDYYLEADINMNNLMNNVLSTLPDDMDEMILKDSASSGSSASSDHSSKPPLSPANTISVFKPKNNEKIQIRDYIYISKDCTHRLAQYCVNENWGKYNVLLYKYLDYIFRCQLFDHQVINLQNKHLIFQTGLQRRCDHEFLFIFLTPNSNPTVETQKWRAQFGGIQHSFLSQNELLETLKRSDIVLYPHYLPQRTIFTKSLLDLLYNSMYSIDVNWEERLTTNADRILKVIGSNAFFDKNNKFLKLTELKYAFNEALAKAQRIAQLNARLAVPQVFVDTKHCKYRMELLLPLFVEFPIKKGKRYTFALAIGKSNAKRRSYVVKSVLTMDMAYSNARLVGYVDSLWLNQRVNVNDFFE